MKNILESLTNTLLIFSSDMVACFNPEVIGNDIIGCVFVTAENVLNSGVLVFRG